MPALLAHRVTVADRRIRLATEPFPSLGVSRARDLYLNIRRIAVFIQNAAGDYAVRRETENYVFHIFGAVERQGSALPRGGSLEDLNAIGTELRR